MVLSCWGSSVGMAKEQIASLYRGTLKHKDWQPNGGFGTLCPKWTHHTAEQSFAGDPCKHPWHLTVAHELFRDSVPDGAGHKYAARVLD
jgi:hypothetical protein